MNDNSILDAILDILNSGFGFMLAWVTIMAAFFWLASKFNPFEEKWKAWEGSIITGIKLAEKQIPNDTPNASLAKLDAALRFVLQAYAESNHGQKPPESLVEELKQAIQIKHADLDRYGGLTSRKQATTTDIQAPAEGDRT